MTSFQRPRISGNLVLVEYGHLQPFWALDLATAIQEEAVPRVPMYISRAIDVVSRDVDGAWGFPVSARGAPAIGEPKLKKLRWFRCRTRPSLQLRLEVPG